MIEFINLTPHVITIFDDNGEDFSLESEGVARCTQEDKVVDNIAGVDIYETTFGEVVGLPAPENGVFYIVSRIVAAACPERKDLLVPGALKRNADGQPIGCIGLARP